jgi:hypothetical protein
MVIMHFDITGAIVECSICKKREVKSIIDAVTQVNSKHALSADNLERVMKELENV